MLLEGSLDQDILLDGSGGTDPGEKAATIIESIQIESRGLSRYSDKFHTPPKIKTLQRR
jgi:hypothetical protein